MNFYIFFFIIVLVLFYGTYGKIIPIGVSKDPPKFSSTYITKAVLFVPHAEVNEPFNIWYDSESNKSRVDYYDGMVKTYQLPGNESDGQMLKIVPVTTKTELNKMTCFKFSDSDIKIQNAVPDLINYTYVGTEIRKGIETEKWEFKGTSPVIHTLTMYLTYEPSTRDLNEKIPIPISFVMKGYDTIFGSGTDHFWIEYKSFTDEKPDISIFEITDMKCETLDALATEHIYTLNPIKEFIDVDYSYSDISFEKFKKKHNKEYDFNEHTYRKVIFKQNLRYIDSKNRANLGYKLAVNHLVDRNPHELRILSGYRYSSMYKSSETFPYNVDEEIKTAPENFDWRIEGGVTAVRDQLTCGSCWSFATVGAIEGEYFVHSSKLFQFSEQALIDCSWGFGNYGCSGGFDKGAYSWIKEHGGLPLADDYGFYYAEESYCHIRNVSTIAPVTGWVDVPQNDSNALKVALLKQGPIFVAIDSSHRSFSYYSNGIYYEPSCGNGENNLTHAVLLVGYGKLDGKDYWLIKNSWSATWGLDGYILMSQENNNCGVATTPSYALF
ncbi:hypothetical protein PGB90_008789 [Kerria lacca]